MKRLLLTTAVLMFGVVGNAQAQRPAPTIKQARKLLQSENPHGTISRCHAHGPTVHCRLKIEWEGCNEEVCLVTTGIYHEVVGWRSKKLVAWEVS